jgi:hypothetical protein
MQKNMLLFHRKQLGPASSTVAKVFFATSMVIRTVWWWIGTILGVGSMSRTKARQSAAAAIYHWTGRKPQS